MCQRRAIYGQRTGLFLVAQHHKIILEVREQQSQQNVFASPGSHNNTDMEPIPLL
jgi:hypothetical protein